MTIQIAQRIGRALGVRSATKTKELDEALREYVRSVSPGATIPVLGTIAASQVVSGTFADARIGVTNVTQHQAALSILNSQLPGYTAADVLAKLVTVDGAGSGLDSDFLDGQSSAAFQLAATVGTWTPADASGAGLAITVNDARYFKIGTLVIASAKITYPVTASGANAVISGLPFAVNANESSRQGNVSYANAAVPLYAVPNLSASTAAFYSVTTSAAATNAQLTGAIIWLQLIYQT